MSLIVTDEEFSRGAARISEMSNEVHDIIQKYEKILWELFLEGLNDNSINNVFVGKLMLLKLYERTLTTSTTDIVNYTTKFITDIDEADSYLYD